MYSPGVKSALQRRLHVGEASHRRHHLLFVTKERQLGASAFNGSVVKFIRRQTQEHCVWI